jgi:hypothetical protein
MVLNANTTAMMRITVGPYLPAAKKAGIPSIIGDEPKMRSSAVRDDVSEFRAGELPLAVNSSSWLRIMIMLMAMFRLMIMMAMLVMMATGPWA